MTCCVHGLEFEKYDCCSKNNLELTIFLEFNFFLSKQLFDNNRCKTKVFHCFRLKRLIFVIIYPE